MNNDLMMAVLSMAAYDNPNTAPDIGFATNLKAVLPAYAAWTGFSAVAYNYNGITVTGLR